MRLHTSIAGSLFAILIPGIVAAQEARSVLRPIPSVGAGFATAQGTGAGLNLLGTLEFGGTHHPLRLRLDGQFTHWQRSAASTRVAALTANLVTELRPTGVRPFLVAGAGGYAGAGTGLRPGWNAGLGLVLPVGGRELVLETRYHEWQRPDQTGDTSAMRYVVPFAIRIRF